MRRPEWGRLYSDEDFPFSVVEELRRLGHDVITIQERGQAGLEVPDETVLAFAHSEGRALLTFNRWDFIRLHKQGESIPVSLHVLLTLIP